MTLLWPVLSLMLGCATDGEGAKTTTAPTGEARTLKLVYSGNNDGEYEPCG